MQKGLGGAAAAALVVGALLAPPATAGGGNGNGNASPPAHAPAHGVNGTAPGQVKKAEQAPAPAPAAAPAPQPSKAERRAATDARKAERRAGRDARKAQRRAARDERRAARKAPSADRATKDARKAPRRAARDARKAERRAARDARKAERRAERDAQRSGSTRSGRGGGQPKTTFCHATQSEKTPYVEITTANPAVIRAHEDHHDGADLIPAPAGGCPKADAAAPVVTPPAIASRRSLGTPSPAEAPAPAPGAPAPVVGTASSTSPAPTGTLRRVAVGIGSSVIVAVRPDDERKVLAESAEVTPTDQVAVLGDVASVDDRAVPAETPAAQVTPARQADDDGGLPFTGMHAFLLALIGAGTLLAGFALHRASRNPS